MAMFKPGVHVKFHLKPEFDSDTLKSALHVTADGFYYGVYFPSHVSRSPQVKRGGQLVSKASDEVVPEHVCPMKPSGENLMLPDAATETFKRVIFTMDKIDLPSLHECDHLDHVPPGRKVDPKWKPQSQVDSEEEATHTAAAETPANVEATAPIPG